MKNRIMINCRYFLVIPIILLFLLLKNQIEKYDLLLHAQNCVNFVGTPVTCSGGLHIVIIAFSIFGILMCLAFLFNLNKKIKYVYK